MNNAGEKEEIICLFKSIDLSNKGFITLADVQSTETMTPEVSILNRK